MKATEQHFPVVLFIMLYTVALTFEFVDEILKCDHSNESYWAVLPCGMWYTAVLTFASVDEIHMSIGTSLALLSCGSLYFVLHTVKFWVCQRWNFIRGKHWNGSLKRYLDVIVWFSIFAILLPWVPGVSFLCPMPESIQSVQFWEINLLYSQFWTSSNTLGQFIVGVGRK